MIAQVADYSHDLWEFFGITPITVWELTESEFYGMVSFVDKQRQERARERRAHSNGY